MLKINPGVDMQCFVRALAVVAFLSATVPAAAQSIGIGHKNAAGGGVDPTFAGGDENNRPVTLTTVRSNADGRRSTSVSTVDFGVVKVASSVVGGGGASADAEGSWHEFLTLTTPGTANGFLNVRLQFDANIIEPTQEGSTNTINYVQRLYATATAAHGLFGGQHTYFYDYTYVRHLGNLTANYVWENNGNVSSVTDFAFQPTIGKTVNLRIPFVSGQTFGIDSITTCSVRSIGGTLGCNAGNSSYWGGVTSVTDAAGAALSGWTLSSASGVDYIASMAPGVPEPASWLMLITGFGLVGAQSRKRSALTNA